MKKCPYCGCEVDDQATACNHCFAEIPNEPKHEEPEQENVPKRKVRR